MKNMGTKSQGIRIFGFRVILYQVVERIVQLILAASAGDIISIIESFVAILQAYIFTYLSVIFVQQALHPAH